MTEEELQAALERSTPERERYELFVEEAQDQDVRVRFSPPSEGWSTAALLAVVEISLRAAAVQTADVLALSRVIRRDDDIVHAETWLFSHAVVEALLHATATLRSE
jgi:hypothetical protein